MTKGVCFTGRYELEDGYVGGSRPQCFKIPEDAIEVGMGNDALERLFYEFAEEHRNQCIGIAALNCEDFIKWANAKQSERE